MDDLNFYEVHLYEQGSDVLTRFLCKATDHAHAREQAIKHYPNCMISNIYLEKQDETSTRC